MRDPQLEDALTRHRLGDSYAAIYPQLPANFPTDEDVKVACKAFNGTYRDNDTGEWVQADWRHDIEDMRAALQAVADARRTGEAEEA